MMRRAALPLITTALLALPMLAHAAGLWRVRSPATA